MKPSSSTRVRFAPSPTGMMHLGNVRTALMNYLFARRNKGIFVLRIEDTDPGRLFDPDAQKIQEDLAWLGLEFDEGPRKGGSFRPYFQSQRTKQYREKLQELVEKGYAYRCFCTQEELEKKRHRQIALKLPPRYDRTCAKLSEQEIKEKIDEGLSFIWRMQLKPDDILEIVDLGRGPITFAMKNFSDIPLTRQDGSFTFMFANCVDDILMNISHVLRGEDHLTNTAGQAALYKAFDAPLPLFWHLPILCNKEGKKLSKRDFGFSLKDLKDAGYLPEAIINYLALVGGGSFEKEIMSLDELVKAIDVNQMHSGGQVKYDLEKLKWINKKWIERLEINDLVSRALPFVEQIHPAVRTLDSDTLRNIISFVKDEATTLKDFVHLLQFYFILPDTSMDDIYKHISTKQAEVIKKIIQSALAHLNNPELFMSSIKEQAKKEAISLKHLFSFVRLCLMGKTYGPSVQDLIELLGPKETRKRIDQALS